MGKNRMLDKKNLILGDDGNVITWVDWFSYIGLTD